MTTDFSVCINMKNQTQISRTATNACDASNLTPLISVPQPSSAPPDKPRLNSRRSFASSHDSPTSRVSRSPSMLPSTSFSSTTWNQSTSSQPSACRKSVSSNTSNNYCPRTSNSHATISTSSSSSVREAKAYQKMGYPAFSAFLASDDDAFVIRKFGTLHVRAILILQDEIVQLEERLAVIDNECANQPVSEADAYLHHNGSFRADKLWHEERYRIVHQLASVLEKYGKHKVGHAFYNTADVAADSLVLKYSKIKERPKAPKRALKNIRTWFEEYPQAITEYETGFLSEKKESDLIGTADRNKTPLRSLLEKIGWFRRSRPFRLQVRRILNYNATCS